MMDLTIFYQWKTMRRPWFCSCALLKLTQRIISMASALLLVLTVLCWFGCGRKKESTAMPLEARLLIKHLGCKVSAPAGWKYFTGPEIQYANGLDRLLHPTFVKIAGTITNVTGEQVTDLELGAGGGQIYFPRIGSSKSIDFDFVRIGDPPRTPISGSYLGRITAGLSGHNDIYPPAGDYPCFLDEKLSPTPLPSECQGRLSR
jgi:hypothetical protein